MFANVERERLVQARAIKVNIPSADRQVERERERAMCLCVCVLFEFRQFFLLWELVYVFQSLCRPLQNNLIVRDV